MDKNTGFMKALKCRECNREYPLAATHVCEFDFGPLEVVYQDYTGSGAETAAHVRENGRIIIMFCAFDGPPQIVRLHGQARFVSLGDSDFQKFEIIFPPHVGTRAFVHVQLNRVSSSCGFSVPFFDFRAERDTLQKWSVSQGPEKLQAYRAKKNRQSIDGMPAIPETNI